MTTATKADLQARIQELEAQLAVRPTVTTPDDIAGRDQRLVGLLKGVKQINRQGNATAVAGLLVNQRKTRLRDGREIKVDLPVDSIIASDNNTPLATQLLQIAAANNWALVAVSGFWVPFGDIVRNERGYPIAQRRQLRVTHVEVLASEPADLYEEDLSLPPIQPRQPEPVAEDEIPF